MRILLLSIFLFSARLSMANRIDELRTEEEISHFADSLSNHNCLFPKHYIPGQLQFKFLKIDIDKNGSTDLLVNDRQVFAIVDKGNDQYNLQYIGSWYQERRIMGIDTSGPLPLLFIKKQNGYKKADGPQFPDGPDTITYKFQGFIEYNSAPSTIDPEYIKFTTSPCRGTCPVFELFILGNGKAFLHAKGYLKRIGQFQTTLSTDSHKEFINLVNYINPNKLNYEYRVEVSDQQSIETEIRLNGKTKQVYDYGQTGTLGLQQLYLLVEKLIDGEQWQTRKE
ncbi:MAG: hypothetical protein J7578_22775 [Chitinophagaceae bacterium]|nr:hypothetical protein [Chitinophagaceae bacterium]